MAATVSFGGFSLAAVLVIFHAQLDCVTAARIKKSVVAGATRGGWELTQVYSEEARIDRDGVLDLNDPADFVRKAMQARDVDELISVMTPLIMMERSSPDLPTLTCAQATRFLWLVTKWRIDAEWAASADAEAVAALKACTSSFEADSTCRALAEFPSKCGTSAKELKQERVAIFSEYQPGYYPPCIPEAVVHEVHKDKATKCEDAAKAGACPGDEGEAEPFMAQYCYADKPAARCCCRQEDVEVQGMFSKLKMGTPKCVSNFLVAPSIEAPSFKEPSVEKTSDEEPSLRWELTQVYSEEARIDRDGSFDLNDPANFVRKAIQARDVEELISVMTPLIMMERSSPDLPMLTCDQATRFLWLVTKWRIDAEWATSADAEAVAALKACTSSFEADSTCRALAEFPSKCGTSAKELKQERVAIFSEYQPGYYPPCIPEAVVHEVHKDKATNKCEDAAKAGACPGDEGEAEPFMAQYCYADKPAARCCCREEDVEVQGMFSKLKMGTPKCVSNFLVAPSIEAPSVEEPSVEKTTDEEPGDGEAAAE